MKYKLILLTLLLIPMAHGYSGWHNSGDNFTAHGVKYSVIHEWGEDKIYLSSENNSLVINLNQCTDTKHYQYCFQDKDENLDSNKVTFEDGESKAGLKIKITNIGPELNINRQISQTNLGLNDQARITVTLENTGNRHIPRYTYKDKFPREFDIVQLGRETNTFTKKGSLQPGQQITFNYDIQATAWAEHTSQANVTYTYADKKITKKSSKTNFKVEAPYQVKITEPKNQIPVGKEFNFNIEIIGKETGNGVEVNNLKIRAPPLNILSRSTKMSKTRDEVTWSGTINPGQTEKLKTVFSAPRVRNNTITFSASFNSEQGEVDYYQDYKIKSFVNGPKPTLNLPDKITGGSKFRIDAKIKNRDHFGVIIPNSTVKLFNEEIKLEKAIVNDESFLLTDVMKAPEISNETTFTGTFSGTYKTPAGEKFNFSTTDQITVQPRLQSLNINIDTPQHAARGDMVNVKVKLKNNLEKARMFSAKDEISQNVQIEGNISNKKEIKPDEEKEMYSYSFKVPNSFSQDRIEITTTALIPSKNITSIKKSFIQIQEEQNEEERKSEKEEEDKGFLTKIVLGIGEWIGSLFT